jgi:hypothetical protein
MECLMGVIGWKITYFRKTIQEKRREDLDIFEGIREGGGYVSICQVRVVSSIYKVFV